MELMFSEVTQMIPTSLGFKQPTLMGMEDLGCHGMKRNRLRRPPGQMRQVVSENLEAELKRLFPDAPDRKAAFEKACGVAMETTRRVLVAQNAANLDTLELIADALEIPCYRLLLPPERLSRKFERFDDTTVIRERPDFSNEGLRAPLQSSSKQIEDAAAHRRARRHGLKLKKV